MTAVKTDADLEEETKSLLLGLYQQASDDLKRASAHAEQAVGFEEKVKAAPELLRVLREQMETEVPVRPADAMGVGVETPHDRLQELLKQKTAELVAAETRRSDIEQRKVLFLPPKLDKLQRDEVLDVILDGLESN